MFDYVFIIYSCKKNLRRANKIYDKINNKFENTKILIIYGDEENVERKYNFVDDKYIVLNVNDDYHHLSYKTLLLIRTLNTLFPNIKGFFKCDDDVNVNIQCINNFLKNVNNTEINYCGKNANHRKCNYSGGPLYYLSKKSMNYFDEPNDVLNNYYEDMMVGYHLNKFNIFVDNANYILYSDNIHDSNITSYHNTKKYEDLYIIIQGGLGNQLFQIAAGISMAKKCNKQFTINVPSIIPNTHQQNDVNRTVSTLTSLFPSINVSTNAVDTRNYCKYIETKNECFCYESKKMEQYIDTYSNVILHGYFINYKYIPLDVFSNIIVTPSTSYLSKLDFTNTYFIHIRLGDYLKHIMYQIELDNYYSDCIDKILQSNSNAKFIVCTNQHDSIFHNYLDKFKSKIKYSVQCEENTDIDTLYIMSSCCGGICSNSTLSFMGSVFQKNKDNLYMPYPFLNFVNGFKKDKLPIDMYPEWCNIYNTLTNEFF
jgi:hypothetical protein